MKFVFYHEGINKSRTMVVDGVEECRVNISHWPNNRTPAHLKADTSTEIALNLAADPYADRLFENIEIVSNNHFDTDGLLSCWSAMNPRLSLVHRDLLIPAAQAGDFEWFTTPQAVQFDLTISAFEDVERSPLRNEFAGRSETEKYQLIYEFLLRELPGLLGDFSSRYRELYQEEFAALVEAQKALTSGRAAIEEFPSAGLSVIEASEIYPRRVRFNAVQHDRLLTLVRMDGEWWCDFHYHITTWFETVTLKKRSRIDLTKLTEQLNEAEGRSEVQWRCDALTELFPRLSLYDANDNIAPSRLSKEFLLAQFLSFFENSEKISTA